MPMEEQAFPPGSCQHLRESSSAWPKAAWKMSLQLQFAPTPPCPCALRDNAVPGLSPQARAGRAATSDRDPGTHPGSGSSHAGIAEPPWARERNSRRGRCSRAGILRGKGSRRCLRTKAMPSSTKEAGAARQERRRVERHKNGRGQGGEGDTHTHTKIRERERQGDNKGGRDHMGEGVPHLLRSSTLLLSLFACPVQGHQSRAAELWVERPYPRGFSCLPRFCIAVREAVISRSVKGPGVTG